LTGNKTGQTIAAMSGSKTFANLDTNTWGFAYAEGSSVPDTATYSALPQGQGKSLASANGNQNNVNKTYALSFATKIGNDKPADTYSNQVTLSVISSPLQVSLSDISTMQEMTANHCSGTVEGFSKQLKDTRDGKYYWVSRLKDGKCWMTQNLDLDLSTSRILTSADSDVAASWTSNRATATVASSATTSTSIEPYSWDLGDYRILYPDQADNCGSGKSDAGQCPGQFSSYVTPTTNNGSEDAHYILGNHYNWLAATAGSGEQATSEATGSICPKGWRLPGREYFEGLLSAYSFIDTDWGSVAQMTNAPLYFVRGGEVRSSSLFANAGYSGTYWTPEGNIVDTGYASYLEVSGNGRLFVNSDYFYYGRSVRCVAR